MRRTYAGLFLVSLTTLVVEVLLTRIFDVILYPSLAFMIISCAIFGLGVGGLFDILTSSGTSSPHRAGAPPSLGRTALLFGVSVWALPLLLNTIPFSMDRIHEEPFIQAGCFLLLYVVLLAPFFFAGLTVCRIFSGVPRDIRRLYFWDLSGAALGTLIVVPLLPPLGPERLLMLASLAGVAAAACFARPRRGGAAGLAATAVVFVLAPVLLGGQYLTLALHDNKRNTARAIELGRLEVSRWDPVSQISVVDQPASTRSPFDHGRKHVAYDGGTQSSDFFPFDGDFATLRRELPQRLAFQFWRRGVLASHYLKRDTGHTALIIGSAGGQETKAALLYGASHVDAVEMVRAMVDLGTGRYAGYISHLFQRPQVAVHVGEGRSFLRASHTAYDVIQIFSNYTSSSIAAGSGAIAPSYLLTEEAFQEYFSHLKPDGILHINHVVYPRMIVTAAAAWRATGRGPFRPHVVVIEAHGPADFLPTVMIKMTPWTAAEIADVQRFFSIPVPHELTYAIVENPLDPAHSVLPDAFYTGSLPSALVEAAPYDVTSVTDDRPYFQFLRRSASRVTPDPALGLNAATAEVLNERLRAGWLPMDWVHLAVASGASVVYGIAFVLLPMLLSRIGRERWGGKAPALTYFSLLGLAFIGIEIVFIQMFMKLIGYPLYAVTTVIAVMLIGAALGSMMSTRVTRADGSRWLLAFLGVIAGGTAIWLSYAPVSLYFMAARTAVRMLVAAGMIFPMAFFMGMPFPLGILELGAKPRGAIAWAWSMNGLFTTVGGVATAMCSLWIGFRDTALAALVVYALAAVAFGVLRRTNRRVHVAPAATPAPRGRVPWRAAAMWRLRATE